MNDPDRYERERAEKKRPAAGVPWAPAAGNPAPPVGGFGAGAGPSGASGSAWFGSRAAATIGTAASPGASSSPLAALAGCLSSRAGFAALTLAAGTLAVGVTFISGLRTPDSRPVLGQKVFDRSAPGTGDGGAAAQASAAAAEQTAEALRGSSLDYFAEANDAKEAEAPARDTAKPSEPAAQEGLRDALRNAVTAKPPPAPQAAHGRAAEKKPDLAPSSSRFSLQGAPALQSAVALKAMADYSTGINSPFQQVYKPPPPLMQRTAYGANRRSSVISPNSGSGAWDQAKFTNGMSRRALGMTSGAGAAASASLPFDGGMVLGGTAKGPSAGGAGIDGAGLGTGTNHNMDSSSISAAPPQPAGVPSEKSKNDTPYQGLIYAGIAALILGQLLVAMAGAMAQSNPEGARALAAAAMAAGGTAAGIGAYIMGYYSQGVQGLPFIIGGGVIAAQAALVLAKAQAAGADAASGVSGAGAAASSATGAALGG